jgi:hypothetical protein
MHDGSHRGHQCGLLTQVLMLTWERSPFGNATQIAFGSSISEPPLHILSLGFNRLEGTEAHINFSTPRQRVLRLLDVTWVQRQIW